MYNCFQKEKLFKYAWAAIICYIYAEMSGNDFLTPKKAKLFKDVRKLKEETNKLCSVFSYNGNVCIKIKEGDRMKIVNDFDQCKQLLCD